MPLLPSIEMPILFAIFLIALAGYRWRMMGR